MTVVCIAGMHRTGTSMVARMLNLCGVYLGEEKDLIPSEKDNPEGFWENMHFVNINNSILHSLKAGWDIIPGDLKPGWERSSLFDQYRKNAIGLINEMSQHALWGWKDPRNSLTFPFWQQLVPDVKVVVCLRNPIEVADSLAKRGYSSKVFSARLWHAYYEKLLTAVDPDNFIITHYDTYFFDSKAELSRLLSFLDLPQDPEKIDSAAKVINLDLKHCQDAWTDLSDFNHCPEIIEMYSRLCAQAGPVFQLSFLAKKYDIKPKSVNQTIDFIGNQLRYKDELIASLQRRLMQSAADKAQAIEDLNRKLRDYIETKNELIAAQSELDDLKIKLQEYIETKKALSAVQAEVDALKIKLQEHIDWIANRDQLINELKWELEVIHNRFGWKAGERFRNITGHIKNKLLPSGKKRTRFIHKCNKAYRVFRDEGTKSALRNTFKILFRRKHKVELINLTPNDSDDAQKPLINLKSETDSDTYVPISEKDVDPRFAEVKPIAFYLPQFHPIPENDEWWGRGFTEWTNVTKAYPNFIGHYQPRLPGELGYYDLRVIDVQKRQVQLAKKYGIHGFCFYYYWFNGKRLLERPLNQFIENPDIDFPFCICWANENWTRCWDGKESDILIGQTYNKKWDKHFIDDLIPVFSDNRYIRVDGKPLLVVYRINLLPDPEKTADLWRRECREKGIGEIFLAVAQSFGISDPRPYGFDGAVEFPMHHLGDSEIDQKALQITNPDFTGRVFDYRIAAQLMMQKQKPDYPLFKTVVPSWDNTARKQNDGHIFINSSPKAYKNWLDNIIKFTKQNHSEKNRFVFINAWNEWAEGNYLEPDSLYGYAYLNATAQAVAPSQKSLTMPDWTILFVSHDAEMGGAQIVLLNVLEWFKSHTSLTLKVLFLNGGKLMSRFKKLADTLVLSDSQIRAMTVNQNELTNQLLDFCGKTPDLIYGNTVVAGKAYNWLGKLGVPILTHFHEMEMSINEYGKAWIGDVLKYSSHFLACSRPVQDNLINKLGVDAQKVSTVYSSVSSDSLPCDLTAKEKKRIKKKLGLVVDKHLIFGCGLGMPFRKGADLFIEVGRILRREGRDDFHLYWIGGFEKNMTDQKYGVWKDYLTILHHSELSSYVTFLGNKEKPKAYFQVGDIFLLPSREDPFPLVSLEAADCGLPTVCFDENVGTADLVGDDAGYCVPFEDVTSMAQKLCALMDDENLRKRMGTRAKEKYLDNFTVERTIPHILTVCRNVAKKKPGVSVIVPNYNHEQYLPQRLDSIFNQTYKDIEVILLDDASEDNSMDVLNRYVNRGDVHIFRNEKNSGSPFKQWLKGFDLAKSDIWWIAESDDVCDPEFLKSLLPAFNDQKNRLVYANSHVINEKGKIKGDYLNTEYLTALSHTKWKTSYVVSAEQEINDGLGVKNTILNISAALFRRFALDDNTRKTLDGMRFAGDWYFIINAIKGGNVKYDARKLNSHRRHTESVIGKLIATNKVDDFYKEMSIVHKSVIENYNLSKDFYTKWERYHRDQWKGFFNNRPFEELKDYYPFEEIKHKLIEINA